MNTKITVVSLDGVLVEGDFKEQPSVAGALADAAGVAVGRFIDLVCDVRSRISEIEEVKLLKEGTTAGVPLPNVRPKDRVLAIAAVGAMAALMVFIGTLVY